MPCDTTYDYNNVDEYHKVLAEYMSVCDNYPDVDYVILAGDLNTDVSRLNSLHTRELTQFISQYNLYPCIASDCADIKHTYDNVHTGVLSTLDHVII